MFSKPPLRVRAVSPPDANHPDNWEIEVGSRGLFGVVAAYIDKDAHVAIGRNVFISPDIQIGLPGKSLTSVEIGDGTTLYGGKFAPGALKIGDCVTMHDSTFMYGVSSCTIGHNSWFGMRTTLDCEGRGWHAGNNFGAGQDTHMWSHIAHGDPLLGCKFKSRATFTASDDVWLVGRCTASPGLYYSKSIAMVGSVLTKGMGSNEIWGGSPAKQLHKMGRAYLTITEEEREILLKKALESYDKHIEPIDISRLMDCFDVASRTYKKNLDDKELVAVHSWLLKKAKYKYTPGE